MQMGCGKFMNLHYLRLHLHIQGAIGTNITIDTLCGMMTNKVTGPTTVQICSHKQPNIRYLWREMPGLFLCRDD